MRRRKKRERRRCGLRCGVLSCAVLELHELGQVGRAIRCEGVHEDGESDSRHLDEAEEGKQVFEGSGESDVGDDIMEPRR